MNSVNLLAWRAKALRRQFFRIVLSCVTLTCVVLMMIYAIASRSATSLISKQTVRDLNSVILLDLDHRLVEQNRLLEAIEAYRMQRCHEEINVKRLHQQDFFFAGWQRSFLKGFGLLKLR